MAPDDPVRVEPLVPALRTTAARLARVVLPVAALVALVWLVDSGGAAAGSAFLANLFDELGRWWNGLPLWQQALVIGGGVALLMLGGASWGFALGAAGLAADVASRGQGIATFLRGPRRATADFFRTLTPADIATYLVGAALSRIVPSGVSRRLGEGAEEAAEAAADRARREAFEGVIPHGFVGAEDFLQFGRRAQEGFQAAGYEDVTLMIRGSAVTGQSYTSGLPFDQGRRSDFDLSVVSPQIWERVVQMDARLRGRGTRTGVLDNDLLREFGLTQVVSDLNAAAGRPVSLMIYRSAHDVAARGPSITWPRP